jgi:hypothetical protein
MQDLIQAPGSPETASGKVRLRRLAISGGIALLTRRCLEEPLRNTTFPPAAVVAARRAG